MQNIITGIIGGLSVLLMLAAPVLVAADVSASARTEICAGINGGGGCNQSGDNNLNQLIRRVVNILLFIIGAVAVIMIVVGGLRYVLSGGDQSATTSAKNTILYAVIGLIVAFAAYAIVNFVVMNI